MPEPETLRDLLERAAVRHGADGKPASTRALAKIAQDAGFDVVYTTIAGILAGTYAVRRRPKRQTLEAIAFLAGVSFEKVHEFAGMGKPNRPFADQIPEEMDGLTAEHRDVVLVVARALLRAQRMAAYPVTAGATVDEHEDMLFADAFGDENGGQAKHG